MNSASFARWPESAVKIMERQLSMKFYENRMKSFSICFTNFILAANGFFKNDDHIECFACGLRIPNTRWDDEGLLRQLHKDASPRCTFMNGSEPNLSEWSSLIKVFNDRPVTMQLVRIQNLLQTANIVVTNGRLFLEHSPGREIFNPQKIYKLFMLRINRQFSFRNVSIRIDCKNAFIDAGFFYTGHLQVVQCAFCRVAYNGSADKHPLVMHRLLSPSCTFLVNDAYDIDRNLCHICFDLAQEILYLPCRHLVSCQECDAKMAIQCTNDDPQQCPICRQVIENKIRVNRA